MLLMKLDSGVDERDIIGPIIFSQMTFISLSMFAHHINSPIVLFFCYIHVSFGKLLLLEVSCSAKLAKDVRISTRSLCVEREIGTLRGSSKLGY